MKPAPVTRVTLMALAVSLLPACNSMNEGIIGRVKESEARASQLARDVGKVDGAASKVLPAVQHDPGIWLGRSLPRVSQTPLPPVFNQPATFERSINSLAEFAERITLRSGIPTKVASDAAQAGQPAAMSGQKSAQPAMPGGFGATGQNQAQAPTPIRIDFSGGSLKGLLDTAAARFGVSWKYANGTIQFFHTDTRTFQIAAVPGDSALSATVSSGASSGGDSGGGGGNAINATNTQNTAVKSTLSVYSSIEKAVGIMLSSQGKVVSSPATGSITVSDTPDNLERIALFIDKENRALSRQVMVNVTVLAVTLTRGDNYGIKWDSVYQTLSRKYGLTNSLASVANSSAFSAAILDTATSRLAGSSMLIEALSEQGQVRRETSASVVTLNNQPVPVQVAKQTSYLKSSQTTLTANVGSSTTLTPGTITTGFNMTILPNVLNNGAVMLQFSTDISTLRSLRTVSSSTATIETPEIETRNFLQRVAMKSNETLVISGFEQTDDNLNQQGVGTPANLLLGGSLKASGNKEVIVILITPIAMRAS
ncbi:PilN family type IVB pilus formation outer membrane protein [Actimicrobium antarcticum]|uniref:PilN family type IVB pilus formation outer membrane protein n=1 Tax=Actimicrobium antarcticum TaxID=1051899 RepID=A0ABP7TAW2_9BURK